MSNSNELVEVAILQSRTHYDNYGDEAHAAITPLLGSGDWVQITRGELDVLIENRYEIAREIGVESLLILEKPTTPKVGMCLDILKKLMQKKEAERIAREKRQQKAAAESAAKAQERKVAQAKRALEKAQKVLKDAGALI